ncbi:uncharacterized protein HMPREF1541_01944 [Cyphellophora europaea CBS 101466]|uniref:NADH:flavin oxidoreductase/NADH oxidase N-terminal domain-containing protein n=1 Tax=Cyphellophora europaea (strain CBS 101466) TaxID=1220924 RepID=W2S250_CYPE1|nr:uncharacterized protein HMPREF1541_01944 [Cyphellophora europaea CBS 101466]ETN42786.1 hypothetical protein HMPREF1541_01944 [Cyphellophora europaea CBS 101466]
MAPPICPLNAPSPEAPYFTPAHLTSPGTPTTLTSQTPTLFTPLTIRATTLRNRILVAPMCQYSTAPTGPLAGALTDYHVATLGHYALKGASLTFIEATGVQARGRISPNCPGLWTDAQIPGVKRVADFVRSQGGVVGVQLAHAGRKASVVAPWVAAEYRKRKGWGPGSVRASEEVGGWPADVVGPMGGEAEAWDGLGGSEEGGYCVPRALTEGEIAELVLDWGRAAKRAVEAGIQVVEIHAAHGYLLHQFLSPVTNRRTDGYGGSFEGRIRLLKEVVLEVRRNIPVDMPLFLRVSSTEWLEGTEVERTVGSGKSWNVEDTLRLAAMLPDWGVDLLDVSSGGNHKEQLVDMFKSKDYQVKIADRIRKEMKRQGKSLLIGAVGLITEAEQAKGIVELNADTNGASSGDASIGDEAKAAVSMTEKGSGGKEPMADVILVARQFMREPEWVLRVAWQLGVDIAWPNQFLRVRFPKL